MPTWDRNTKWRQGLLIPCDSFKHISIEGIENFTHCVVISHDCDLSQDMEIEEHFEIILGKSVHNIDGNITHAKNPRKLQLSYQDQSNPKYIELYANQKRLISKKEMSNEIPIASLCIDSDNRLVLQKWLSARYRRSAFSDEFNVRMRNTKVERQLQRLLKTRGTRIRAIFFDIDEGEEQEHSGESDPFTLVIYLVFDTKEPSAQHDAEILAEDITNMFRDKCKKNDEWINIELSHCYAMSDKALSFAQSIEFQQWNVDYMSLREDPQGSMP